MLAFKQISPERAQQTIERLQERWEQALQDLERSKEELGEIHLAVEEGQFDSTHQLAVKARNGIEEARLKLSETELALGAARIRHKKALEEYDKIDTARKWKKVREMAIKREKLATQLEAEANSMVEILKEYLALSEEQYYLAPVKERNTFHDTNFSPSKITQQLKRYLYKLGWETLTRYPPDASTIANFSDVVAESNKWILKLSNEQGPESADAA